MNLVQVAGLAWYCFPELYFQSQAENHQDEIFTPLDPSKVEVKSLHLVQMDLLVFPKQEIGWYF